VAVAEINDLKGSLSEKESMYSTVDGELKVERDWRKSLEEMQEGYREKLNTLNSEVTELRASATVSQCRRHEET